MKRAVQNLIIISIMTIFSTQAVGECLGKKNRNKIISSTENIQNNLEVANFLLRSGSKENFTLSTKSIAKDDKRIRKHTESPEYLDAVLKIITYLKGGKVLTCSGALIGSDINQSSRVAITALHCGVFNSDVEKIEVYATTANKVIKRMAKRSDQASYENDWAIIILDEVIPNEVIKPILIFTDPDDRGDTSEDLAFEYEGEITVAGYSTDAEVGGDGRYMTYETFDTEFIFEADTDYYIYGQEDGFGMVRSFTYPGASGGPVIANIDYDENGTMRPYIASLIKGGFERDTENFHSSGNGVKGSLKTKVVPMERFQEASLKVIGQYNK